MNKVLVPKFVKGATEALQGTVKLSDNPNNTSAGTAASPLAVRLASGSVIQFKTVNPTYEGDPDAVVNFVGLAEGNVIETLGLDTVGDGFGRKYVLGAVDEGNGLSYGSLWLNDFVDNVERRLRLLEQV